MGLFRRVYNAVATSLLDCVLFALAVFIVRPKWLHFIVAFDDILIVLWIFCMDQVHLHRTQRYFGVVVLLYFRIALPRSLLLVAGLLLLVLVSLIS